MKKKYLATACALTFGAAGVTFGGGAFAQSPNDMKVQIEALQHQLQILKERLDKQEAQQAQKAAQAPARAAAAAAVTRCVASAGQLQSALIPPSALRYSRVTHGMPRISRFHAGGVIASRLR